MAWLEVDGDEAVQPGDYLVRFGPFPVDIPVEIPEHVKAVAAAGLSALGYWDANFRGEGRYLMVSYRIRES